jgi:hypothetical protein
METIILTIITNNKKNNLETSTNEKKTDKDEKKRGRLLPLQGGVKTLHT